MCWPIRQIQNAMKEVNYSLFQIKDLTLIIVKYAISIPTKVLHTTKLLYHQNAWELRFSNNKLFVNTRTYHIFSFLVEKDGRLTQLPSKYFETDTEPVGFDIDEKTNKMIAVGKGYIWSIQGDKNQGDKNQAVHNKTLKHDENKLLFDVTIDSKNNAFYVLGSAQLQMYSLSTNIISKIWNIDVSYPYELQLCSDLNLIAIRFLNSFKVYELQEYKLKFEIKERVYCMCFHVALDSLIVLDNDGNFAFYNLETGLCREEMHINRNWSYYPLSIVCDPNTGYLIASDARTGELVVFG
jgi:hypothetical protein